MITKMYKITAFQELVEKDKRFIKLYQTQY